MVIRVLFSLGAVAALSACELTPGAGPTADVITSSAAVTVSSGEKPEPFALFEMDRSMAMQLKPALGHTDETGNFPPDAAPPPFLIRVGDTVSVTIVSVDTTGFLDFSQSAVTPLSSTVLPDQVVASDGRVQVPPVGRVRANGVTPETLEKRLAGSLGDVLIDPSVVVQVTDRQSARASVLGQVDQPSSIPLLRDDYRILDLIALAGGQVGQVEDQVVSLNRRGSVSKVRLSEMLAKPSLNIRVWPEDVITVEGARRSFMTVGGVGRLGRFEFDQPVFTLSEAIGKSGALVSNAGARHGLFVYRVIPTHVIEAMGADASGFTHELTPAIFHFNFGNPATMFAAGEFEMADGDVIYVSDALTEELNKVLSVVTRFVTPTVVQGGTIAGP